MSNRNIRPEWVPSAYRETSNADKGSHTKSPSVKATLYGKKGVNTKEGFKRRNTK